MCPLLAGVRIGSYEIVELLAQWLSAGSSNPEERVFSFTYWTARKAWNTQRTAIGLMAGPESPAVTLAMRGLRVSTSIDIATNVLTNERASAPAS